MSARIRLWAQRLLDGEPGSTIVREMRRHYNSVASLKACVSVLRRHFMDADLKRGQRQVHPSYPATLKKLRALHRALDRKCNKKICLSACRDKLKGFLEAPLRRQVALVRNHLRKKFCFGVEAVDKVFAGGLKLLPDNMAGLRITAEEHEACRAREVATQLRRNEAMLVVKNGNALLQKLCRLAGRPERVSLPALILALCGLSGRRFAEIVNGRSTFSAVRHTKFGCRFLGQLKKQPPVLAYDIPLLAPFSVFQHALKVLRRRQREDNARFDQLSNADATTRWQPRARVELPKLFPCLKRPHDLRALYAAAVHSAFDFGPITFNRVCMQVLGHSSLAQSLAYNTVLLKRFTQDFGRFPLVSR